MYWLFLWCAVLAGSVFLIQSLLAVMGFGLDELDIPDDIPDDLPADGDTFSADHGSTWLFGVISFRTIVAALTFFGLAGLATDSAGATAPVSLTVAILVGLAAMYSVYWLMKVMMGLGQDGSLRIENSVGLTGTVYIPIPGESAGTGKIQMKLQNRIIEYAAQTADKERLSTGTQVRVVEVISPTTLQVARLE
ncbi:MAG: hypothetical protein WDZ51_09495 [Pirellulaceae bacterium]